MKNRYEALLALDTRGKDESAKDIVDRLEKFFAAEGASVEQVQRLEKRELTYEHAHLASAYFVNIIFEAEPTLIETLRSKLKLDADVAMQNYIKLGARKPSAPNAA